MSAPTRFKVAVINNSGAVISGEVTFVGKHMDPSTGKLVEGTEYTITLTSQGTGVANAVDSGEITDLEPEYDGWISLSAGTGTDLVEIRLLIATDGATGTFQSAGEGELLLSRAADELVADTTPSAFLI